MRRHRLFAALPSRCAAVAAAGIVTLCATTALAAPAAPPPGPATSTQVVAPASQPAVVVVNNTTTVPAAPAAAPAPVVVAPAPTVLPVAPVAAPATVPGQMRVDMYPHPMAPPSAADHERLRKVAEQSRARSLRAAGWATLGGTYGFSALVGTLTIDTAGTRRMRGYGYWMVIPVAGPFGAALHSRSATGALLTTALGIGQVAGLTMAIVGGHRYRRFKRQLMVAAAPAPGGGHVGVSMRF